MSRIFAFKKSRRLHPQAESGLVSIMTVMVFMIIISLIVVGFAQISRRDQRESLDQELSTQAFYAAESGINDASNLIRTSLAAGKTVQSKPDCTNGSGAEQAFYSALPSATIDATNNLSYTCLMVNPTPPNLSYSNVGSSQSTIIPLDTSTGVAFSTVTLTWQTTDNTKTPISGCPASTTKAFTTTAAWTGSGCGYGVLRFDLVPTNSAALTVNSLQSQTMTAFVVPLNAGGTPNVTFAAGTANANDLIGGKCDNTQCSLTINVSAVNSSQFYARVSSLYKNVSLQVNGKNTDGSTTQFANAQILIDSTGKAQDELRRIQVRTSLLDQSTGGGSTSVGATSGNQLSDYALESTDSICKRFTAMSGFYQNQVTGVISSNPMCK